jgi:hypothetical protein
LRSAEDLTDCHEDSEEIVHFQPSNDQRSLQDLIDYQEGSGRFPNGQMGKGIELRSAEDLKHYQRGREEKTLHCQLGNERRSDEDLEDCQEGSGSISDC